MKLKVTKDLCEIKENEVWNVGDYNVHTVQVELSPEFNGLVNKVRYFVEDNSYDMLITDNVAQVPYEATVMEGTIKIGVYGYDADTDILVQSTSPVNKYITSGTYTGDPDNTQPLTPTDKEQMETAIQKNTNDITDLKANKQDTLISGVNIKTLNNESLLGNGNINEIDPVFTESPAYSITDNDITYWNNKANISDIPDVSNFITKDVDNLTYYTKSTDMQTAINDAVGNERTARENADNNLQNQIDAITVSSDVVDVVSTYQDLVDYDTQHIKANNIIKVMQDSTHDNAISYYRWVIVNHVGSWEYVGSEGPYYTKSETDTLLNAKQNTLVSGQNIKTINNESLLGEGNINIQSGGTSDYADLSNKPKINNVELNGNKSLNDLGIQPAGNYALESDMTEAQNDIDHLSKLSNLFGKITGTGTNITLNDTSECPMKIELGANTYQYSTTGKNKLKLKNTNNRGLQTTLNDDGSISVSGTATETIAYIDTGENTNLVAGAYTFSIQNTLSVRSRLFLYNGSTQIGAPTIAIGGLSATLTTTQTITNYSLILLDLVVGNSYNFKIYPMLESGSSATSWEPYTGGQPAPSPSYPQEIHVIKGNNEIKVEGKNLIGQDNISNLSSATGTISGTTLTFTSTGTYKKIEWFIPVKVGDTFTFSCGRNETLYLGIFEYSQISTSASDRLRAIEWDSKITTNGKTSSFTIQNNGYLRVYLGNASAITTTIENVMLEKNPTATEYQPHQEQTYPINLGSIELCKIGDYEDVLFKNTINSEYYNSSLELNKWYKLNNIGKTVLNGSENWNQWGIDTFYITKLSSVRTGLSNYFKYNSTATGASQLNNGEFFIHDNTNHNSVIFKNSSYTTVADFKTWLSTHNTTLYYVLETPTYTLLNDTLQTQLNNLQYALACDTQTNISQTNTDLPFIINAETYKEINLADYVKNTDYASSSKGGVIKVGYGCTVTPQGNLISLHKTYPQYQSGTTNDFISKGTLENVITGKGLDLKQLPSYDNTKTQVLKNINGTLTWVDES